MDRREIEIVVQREWDKHSNTDEWLPAFDIVLGELTKNYKDAKEIEKDVAKVIREYRDIAIKKFEELDPLIKIENINSLNRVIIKTNAHSLGDAVYVLKDATYELSHINTLSGKTIKGKTIKGKQ